MSFVTPRTWVAGDVLTAAQLNQDVRDNVAAIAPIGMGAWTAWTPTFVNFTLGNGSVEARYTRIGRTVHFFVRVQLGSTSVMGAEPTLSLPVATAAHLVGHETAIAHGRILDFGTTNYLASLTMVSTTTALVRAFRRPVTYTEHATISSTVPMTWATNDVFSFTGTYEAAA